MHIPIIILIALAVGISITLIQFLRVINTLVDANPFLVIMSGNHDYGFLFTPVLSGAVLFIFAALLVNNVSVGAGKANYWLGFVLNKN